MVTLTVKKSLSSFTLAERSEGSIMINITIIVKIGIAAKGKDIIKPMHITVKSLSELRFDIAR